MNKGLNTDFSPLLQPDGTYRYALNAVNQSHTGDFGFLSKEESASIAAELPFGYKIIGSIYIGDDNVILFLVFNNVSEIGILNKYESYTTLVNCSTLEFNEQYPIRATFRARKNNERIIYFVDGKNKPRAINIDTLENYYTTDYTEWLEIGKSAGSYKEEKWDSSKFNLIKSYTKIPNFENVEIIEAGSIKPGSYSFGVMYLDEDLNHTNVITTSNPIIIYNDSLKKEYNQIRGSRNIDSALMSYERTNKSIRLSLSNFDESYPYYKVVIIQTNAMTGKPNAAFVSDIISITESIYSYNGDDTSLTSISLDDIAIDRDDINNVEFITQIENRLILGKYKTKNIDYSSFQKYASKISSHLATKKVYLNSIGSYGNAKDPLTLFDNVGYMPGEVYSFGICYVFKDGTISPVYHIPGRNKNDIREAINGFDDNMDYYETPDFKYPEIHNHISKPNYWGKDNYGDYLIGTPKRHHKFPTRKDKNLPLYTKSKESVTLYEYSLTMTVKLKNGKTYPINPATGEPIIITTKVGYRKENAYTDSEFITVISNNIEKENVSIKVYRNEYPLELINGSYGIISGEILKYLDRFSISFSYEKNIKDVLSNAYYTDLFGIKFSNVELPHPDVIGYFIVRNERTDSDKIIVDSGILGPVTAYNKDDVKYRVFNKWTNVANGENINGSIRQLDNNSLYFYNPEFQFKGKTLDFDYVDIQGYFSTIKMTSYNNGEPPSTGNYNTRDYSIVLADVAEGTSYNPDVHADKDSDGFNLVIGYRNSNVEYHSLDNGDINWHSDNNGDSLIDNIFYIGAANSKFYNGKTFYNACQDNKIGIIKFKDDFKLFNNQEQRNLIFGEEATNIYYAQLKVNNDSAYTNFLDRNYYKEHNNVILFKSNNVAEDITLFNGDSYINAITPVASTYYGMKMADRKKKDKKSSGILGVALIVVGLAATIFTAGAALGVFGALSTGATIAITAVGAMALSAGSSMYSSYIELEALKKMISEDYPKGLQDAIVDKDMSDHPTTNYPYGCGLKDGTVNTDDAIMWFADRVTDLFIESPVNFGLRTSLTSVGIDFINPLSSSGNTSLRMSNGTTRDMSGFDEEEFRSYLVEKLTVIAEGGTTSSSSYSIENSDKTVYQGTVSGRVYRGYAHAEWYDVNPDFQTNNQSKVFIHLPITYDSYNASGDYSIKYNNRLLYSQQAFQEELTDNYRVFLVNNYKDMDGEFGSITGLFKASNNLFVHTAEGLWQVPRNLQEKVTNELTTYIGTGEFLALSPIKIDDGFISYGSQSDYSTLVTNKGVFFVNQRVGQVFLMSNKEVTTLSDKGLSNWFLNNLPLNIKNQLYELTQYQWKINNPMISCGIFATYDNQLDRIILTKKDFTFINTDNFVGTFDNNKLDYQENDIFIGDYDKSNNLYADNTFYIVKTPYYLKKRNIDLTHFVPNNNVTINDISLVNSESFSNVTGYWFNKNQFNYETIDYGSNKCIMTVTDSINWLNLSVNEIEGLNNNYINAYFEFDFTPNETKDYFFNLKSSGTVTMYIDNVLVTNNKASLIADQVYSIRIDFVHREGNAYIQCDLASTSDNNGILFKTDKGIIEYTPYPDFEGEDIFNVITNKTIDGVSSDQIKISVKNRDGEEKNFPYFLLVSQTEVDNTVYITDVESTQKVENFDRKYRKVYTFPITGNGIINITDSITVPHTINITYGNLQTFTIDKNNSWNKDLADEYHFNINYQEEDYFTVIVDCDWINHINNDSFIKSIFFTIDYQYVN